MRKLTVYFALLACGLMLPINSASAQDPNARLSPTGRPLNWAEQMFDKHEHQFGVVARGADVVWRIKVTNKYVETIHISEAHTSCNCISAKILTNTLKTWEEGIIEVRLNTLQYSRDRHANVIVTIDQPAYMQVTLPITAYIRTDVVIEPGSAILGTVSQGETSPEHRLRISYAGSPNWRISEVRSRNPNLVCAVRELSRQPNGGTANILYELNVKLTSSTPAGDLREQILLMTNDVNSPQIPVLVEGRVLAEYSITPPSIALKGMKPGDKEEVKVVIRGQKPFVVEKIESNSGSEAYQIKPLPKDRFQIVQILNIIVNAPEKPGPMDEVFTLTLAGQGPNGKKQVEFKLNGKVLGDEANSSKEGTESQTVTTAKPPVAPPPPNP